MLSSRLLCLSFVTAPQEKETDDEVPIVRALRIRSSHIWAASGRKHENDLWIPIPFTLDYRFNKFMDISSSSSAAAH